MNIHRHNRKQSMKKELTIGVLGGMGTYASIHLFRQYAQIFPAQKEWERPRIIIDNRCTMPSRVRAYLYGERKEQLIFEMTDSIKGLMKNGCSRIILACNTAHLFLKDIYSRVPEASEAVVDITEACADEVLSNGEKEIYLLASEGTIASGIYERAFTSRGISCVTPEGCDHSRIRDCIEAVKRDQYTDAVRTAFSELMHGGSSLVLGCTELPILYERYPKTGSGIRVYDPVQAALIKIHREYSGEYADDKGTDVRSI